MERALLAAICLSAFLLFAGCAAQASRNACTQEAKACPDGSYVGRNSSNNCKFDQCPAAGGNSAQLANPASLFCTQKGYRLEMRKDAQGGEAGYCIFPNGGECEEWAFFRGQCSQAVKCAAFPNCIKGTAASFVRNGSDGCPVYECVPEDGTIAQQKFTECPGIRPDVCTTEYSPVCGRSGATESLYSYQDYSNPCVACSKSSPATGYYGGTCEQGNISGKAKDPSVLYPCPAERSEACAQAYDPVCGRAVDASSSLSYYRDYPSPCEACSKASNAIAYYLGTCAGRKL